MQRLVSTGAVAIIVMAAGVVTAQMPVRPTPEAIVTVMAERARIRLTLSPTAVFDRILSFDANADNRISRDELPERMDGLVVRGDLNKDGFLTPNEIVLLVDVSSPPRPPSSGFHTHAATRLADVVADLKLPASTHTRALEIVNGSRNVNPPANIDVQTQMKNLLGDEDYENYVAAVARLRGASAAFGGSVGGVVGGIPSRPR